MLLGIVRKVKDALVVCYLQSHISDLPLGRSHCSHESEGDVGQTVIGLYDVGVSSLQDARVELEYR